MPVRAVQDLGALKPGLVLGGTVVHFVDSASGRGGKGGVTWCGIAFVPHSGIWTRDVRRVAKGRACSSCKACIEEASRRGIAARHEAGS